MKARILVVDDSVEMCEVLREGLMEHGFDVTTSTHPQEALNLLRADAWDAVVTDLNMPGCSGLDLCRQSKAIREDLPVVLITAFGTMEAAIEALRAGAWDFVTKPVDPDHLAHTLNRSLELGGLRREVEALRRVLWDGCRFEGIIGQSPPMRELFTLLERVSGQDVTILVQGETGTGKELIARSIHARSPRARGPFVAFSGAALPDGLVESELFGHVRGAFTDARTPRRGLLFEADGGTLFLDEVAEIPLSVQPKLLRALQERTVRPLGGEREQPFDVRVIAASNRDLGGEVAAGRFRADLYYRLNIVEVDVPPLRARGNDVLLLAQHFVEATSARLRKNVKGLSPEAVHLLIRWKWPGNVRELQNAMERAVALTQGETVRVMDLPRTLRTETDIASPEPESRSMEALDMVERRHILQVLESVGGSKSAAARILGLSRTTLYRRLEEFDER
jgi:two-component system response regulator HydG